MDFFPAFLDLKQQPCLVVGGGDVAERKVRQLREAGARVTVVSPGLTPELESLVREGDIDHRAKGFEDADIQPCAVIIAATDNREVNARVATLARERYIPVNVVDAPELCTFIVPSMIDRSPLQIAISTGGASPVLARLLRARLESSVPASFGKLAGLVERFRGHVKQAFDHGRDRKAFWEKVLQGHIAELVFSGREGEAEEQLQVLLRSQAGKAQSMGEVYLIGAGPGDPDLLTFRALRLMQQAEVVLYDRLVSPQILNLIRRDAERIYVGKAMADHAVPQDQINQMLADLAKQGKRVVRLKGGDPFMFGRGGEEIQLLAEQGVPFQVVPGITAAVGCAAYTGIPLTHRDYSQYAIFVTGHLKDGTMDLNWDMLAQPNKTVVFYMGLSGVEVLCRELKAHGMPAQTAAALVEKGTTDEQRVLIGNIDTLPEIVRTNDVRAPTLIIVGDVVKLHDTLKWYQPNADITEPA
ncbi:MAG: siroheme synthase CysG [Gammaproteobacteria bacterium]